MLPIPYQEQIIYMYHFYAWHIQWVKIQGNILHNKKSSFLRATQECMIQLWERDVAIMKSLSAIMKFNAIGKNHRVYLENTLLWKVHI